MNLSEFSIAYYRMPDRGRWGGPTLEHQRCVVRDDIDAIHLSESLTAHGNQDPSLVSLPERLVRPISNCSVQQDRLFDLREMCPSDRVVEIPILEISKDFQTLFILVRVDEEPWRFGYKERSDSKGESTYTLDRQWDSPRHVGSDERAKVVDPDRGRIADDVSCEFDTRQLSTVFRW